MKAIVVFVLVLASTLFAQRPKLLWEAQGHYWLTEIVVSQDGRHCGTYGGAFGYDATAKLWTVLDRSFLTKTAFVDPAPVPGDFASIRGISLSPRGTHIAIHGSRGFGDSVATAPGEAPLPTWVFTLRGAYLERAITWDLTTVAETRDSLDENWQGVLTFLTIRNVGTGDTIRSAEFVGRSLHYPLASPDNKTVAYYDRLQKEIVFIDMTTASIIGTVNAGKQNQTKAFSLDGAILTTLDDDSVISRWDVATRTLLTRRPVGDRAGISNDGQFFCTVPSEDSLAVFRTADGSYLGSRTDRINGIYGYHDIVDDLRMGPQIASDGSSVRLIYRGLPDHLLTTTESEYVTWVASLSTEEKPQLLYPIHGLTSMCLTRNQSVCILYINGLIEERDLLTGNLTRTFNIDLPAGCAAHSLWSTNDQRSFFVTTEHQTFPGNCSPTITRYDAETFAVIASFPIDTLSQHTSFFEAPNGQFYTTRPTLPRLTKFSIITGDTIHWLNDTLHKYGRFTFSSDGKQMTLWNAKGVPAIVNTESGELIKELYPYITDCVQFDPTGQFLYLGMPWSNHGDLTAGTHYMLYDLASDTLLGQQAYQRQLNDYYVTNFYWLNDNRSTISISQGGYQQYYNRTGILVFNPFTEAEPTFTYTVSMPWASLFTRIGDKEYLITMSSDNTLAVWEVDYTPASVAREKVSTQVAAFPNPSQKVVLLSFDFDIALDTRFVLSDITGREIAVTYKIDPATKLVSFDVATLPEGMYIVHAPAYPQLSVKFIKTP